MLTHTKSALKFVTGTRSSGTPLKRIHAAAQGRATPIKKRTSHVEIHVRSKE